MRHRVERMTCPVCRNNAILKPICTGCNGKGEAVMLHKPGYEVEIHDLADEARLRAEYPDEPTPVHERTTLEQSWQSFMAVVEILHAPPAQRREMKRAFFAGAHWMLDMCSIQMDPDGEPTADDLEYLQRVHAEIMTFNDNIQSGRA